MRNYSSVLDPELAVALVRNFTQETGLRFPLVDGRPVAEWPNGATLGRALGYLDRIADSFFFFLVHIVSIGKTAVNLLRASPYNLG